MGVLLIETMLRQVVLGSSSCPILVSIGQESGSMLTWLLQLMLERGQQVMALLSLVSSLEVPVEQRCCKLLLHPWLVAMDTFLRRGIDIFIVSRESQGGKMKKMKLK